MTDTIVQVDATAFVPGPTASVAALRALLDAFAADTILAPSHGSDDDRTKKTFDAATLAGKAEEGPAVWLWRQGRPRYWGSIGTSKGRAARIIIHHERLAADDVAPACEAIAALMGRLQPSYGAMHFRWNEDTDERKSSRLGIEAKPFDFLKLGPPGVFAVTWFGPWLTEALGEGPLVTLGGRRQSWGGVSLALGDPPWEKSFAELRARQVEVDAALRPKGFFGQLSPRKKGPNWEYPA